MSVRNFFLAATLLALLVATTAGAQQPRPVPAPPIIGAKSYLVIDATTGKELAALDPDLPTYLCFDATLEFPYSQTNFAAGQAAVSWDAPRLDLRREDGSWETLVPDTGAPGGMMRTVAVDVSGMLPAGPCALRLTANLELYYDRVFLAQDRGADELVEAEGHLVVGRLGVVVDGRHRDAVEGADLEVAGVGLVHVDVLVVLVRQRNRTDLGAVAAGRALGFIDETRLLAKGDLEIAGRPFNMLYFGAGNEVDIEMPADLDQFG